MKLGGYKIEVMTTSLPQKIATGFDKTCKELTGASYEMIAYLGSKVTNGTNHAFLANQTLITGKDISSIVLIVLNEKPNDVGGNTFSIVSIEPLLSNGGKLGGLAIAPTTKIPEDAKALFDKHFNFLVGASVEPIALLGTQMVHGGAYVFAIKSSSSVNPESVMGETETIQLVKVYSDYSDIDYIEVLRGQPDESNDKPSLGYAFTWLTKTRSDNSFKESISWR